MAFQLFVPCLVGVFLGRWLDERMHLERPLWAILLAVLFLLASLYAIYRQLLSDK